MNYTLALKLLLPLIFLIFGKLIMFPQAFYGNPGKIAFMEMCLMGLPVEIVGIHRAAEEKGIALEEVAETGATPLENA